MRDRILIVGGLLIGGLLLAMVLFAVTGVGTWYCDDVRYPDIDARFDVLVQQCMVHTDAGWVPEDRYRVVP
jgi:hypothetical protein